MTPRIAVIASELKMACPVNIEIQKIQGSLRTAVRHIIVLATRLVGVTHAKPSQLEVIQEDIFTIAHIDKIVGIANLERTTADVIARLPVLIRPRATGSAVWKRADRIGIAERVVGGEDRARPGASRIPCLVNSIIDWI